MDLQANSTALAAQGRWLRAFGIVAVFATIFPLSYATHLLVTDATDVWTLGTLLALLSIAVPLAIIVTLMRRLGTTWPDYGLAPIAAWKAAGLGLLLAVVMLAVVKFAVAPGVQALGLSPPDIRYLMPVRGNLPGYLFVLAIVWSTAAFGEEMIFRGFVLNELAALIGSGRAALWLSAILSGVLFGLGHVHQGAAGILITGATGCPFGAAYVLLGRNLWPLIIAHGLIDTLSITSIYLA